MNISKENLGSWNFLISVIFGIFIFSILTESLSDNLVMPSIWIFLGIVTIWVNYFNKGTLIEKKKQNMERQEDNIRFCEYCKKKTQHLIFNNGQKQCRVCGKGNKKECVLKQEGVKK